MELVVIAWLICVGIGAYIANQKGRSMAEGLVLGLLLGFIGVLIEALLPAKSRCQDTR